MNTGRGLIRRASRSIFGGRENLSPRARPNAPPRANRNGNLDGCRAGFDVGNFLTSARGGCGFPQRGAGDARKFRPSRQDQREGGGVEVDAINRQGNLDGSQAGEVESFTTSQNGSESMATWPNLPRLGLRGPRLRLDWGGPATVGETSAVVGGVDVRSFLTSQDGSGWDYRPCSCGQEHGRNIRFRTGRGLTDGRPSSAGHVTSRPGSGGRTADMRVPSCGMSHTATSDLVAGRSSTSPGQPMRPTPRTRLAREARPSRQ